MHSFAWNRLELRGLGLRGLRVRLGAKGLGMNRFGFKFRVRGLWI